MTFKSTTEKCACARLCVRSSIKYLLQSASQAQNLAELELSFLEKVIPP